MKQEEFVIQTKEVNKYYNRGLPSEVHVLKDVSVSIRKGDFISVMGPSGSGKTTLLDIMGCLMKPSSGTVCIDGTDTAGLDDNELARIRGRKIGFIFQQYNLLPALSAIENVELSMRIMGRPKPEARARAMELLAEVGLEQRFNNKPAELSGGEQQRVAIARALSNEPKIILGDEPTGNLDTVSGRNVMEILERLNKNNEYTIVLVTHDPGVGKVAKSTIRLRDGMVVRS